MLKRFRYIVVFILLFSFAKTMAQIAMPDTVCAGTARRYQVNTPSTPSTYTWTVDGVVQPATTNELNMTWSTPGTFMLSVLEYSNGGCEGNVRTGLVYVLPFAIARAGPDTTICFGKNIQLSASGGLFYQWSPSVYLSNPNIANPVASPPLSGMFTYFVSVSNGSGCSSVDRAKVMIRVLPPVKIFAGNDTAISLNEPLQLNATDVNSSGFDSYAWSPAFGLNNPFVQNPVANLNQNMVYMVTAKTSEGCTAADTISIKFFEAASIYVPSAFTPNKDGLNDIFRPILVGIRTLKNFSVFNRFGQLVYTTSTPGAGWDGTIYGVKQSTATFVWMVEAVDYKGNVLTKKGTVVLIR